MKWNALCMDVTNIVCVTKMILERRHFLYRQEVTHLGFGMIDVLSCFKHALFPFQNLGSKESRYWLQIVIAAVGFFVCLFLRLKVYNMQYLTCIEYLFNHCNSITGLHKKVFKVLSPVYFTILNDNNSQNIVRILNVQRLVERRRQLFNYLKKKKVNYFNSEIEYGENESQVLKTSWCNIYI